MKITVPTTSSKLVNILTKQQLDTLQQCKDDNPTMYFESNGGTTFWSMVGDAVVNECGSIKDGDIFLMDLDSFKSINKLKIIAESSGVSINIEIL